MHHCWRDFSFQGLGHSCPWTHRAPPKSSLPRKPPGSGSQRPAPPAQGPPQSLACGVAFGTDPGGVRLLPAASPGFRGEANQTTLGAPWLGGARGLARPLGCSTPGLEKHARLPTADRGPCRPNTTHSRWKLAGTGPRNQFQTLSLEQGLDQGGVGWGEPPTRPAGPRKPTATPRGCGGSGGRRNGRRRRPGPGRAQPREGPQQRPHDSLSRHWKTSRSTCTRGVGSAGVSEQADSHTSLSGVGGLHLRPPDPQGLRQSHRGSQRVKYPHPRWAHLPSTRRREASCIRALDNKDCLWNEKAIFQRSGRDICFQKSSHRNFPLKVRRPRRDSHLASGLC